MIFWLFLVRNHYSASLYFIFLLNKVILLRKFRFYLIFCVDVFLSAFGMLSSYYGVWFFICLLQHGVVCRLIVTLYLCEGDSDK